MDSQADPGWASAIPLALRSLVTGGRLRYGPNRGTAAQGLLVLRGIFLSFALGIVLVGVAVAALEATGAELGSTSEPAVAAGVVAVGLASLAATRLVRRPLPCESESALEQAYRQRFFLHIALGESAALVGFVGFVLSSAGWVYLVGAFFTAIAFAWLAPTARHVEQDQEELRRRGCGLSLVAALNRPPTTQAPDPGG